MAAMSRLTTLLCLLISAAAGQPGVPEAEVQTQQAMPTHANEPVDTAPPEPEKEPAPPDASFIAEKWGVQVQSARLTAGGYMIDVRLKVLDSEKASPLFDRRLRPVLVDQATKARFTVPSSPKVGMLRTSRAPKRGATAFIMFANPGNYIKAGSRVNIHVGEFVAAGVEVE